MMKKRLIALLLTVALLCIAMVVQVASAFSEEALSYYDFISLQNMGDYYVKEEKIYEGEELVEDRIYDYSFNDDGTIDVSESLLFDNGDVELYAIYSIKKEYDEKHRLISYKVTPDEELGRHADYNYAWNYADNGTYNMIDLSGKQFSITYDSEFNNFFNDVWTFEYDDKGRKTRMIPADSSQDNLEYQFTYKEENGKTVKKNYTVKVGEEVIESGTVDIINTDNGSIHREVLDDGNYLIQSFNKKNQVTSVEMKTTMLDAGKEEWYLIKGSFNYDNNGNIISFFEALEQSDGSGYANRADFTYEYHPAFPPEEPEVPDEPDTPSASPKLPFFVNGIALGLDGKWAMYKNGVVDTSYTGVAKNAFGWWRVKNGYVDFNACGIYKNEFGWWKTTKGKVTFKETGVFKNEYGWWRVVNSKVDFKASGIYKNKYGWWKTTNGKVTFDETGVFKNQFGWWYVKDSKVDFNFTGIASNQYGTWYIKNGKVDFTKNGKVDFDGKTYQVTFGKAKLA